MVKFHRSNSSRGIDVRNAPWPASRVHSVLELRSRPWPPLRKGSAVFCMLLACRLGASAVPLVESDDSELSVAPDEFELELLVYGRGRVLLNLQGGATSMAPSLHCLRLMTARASTYGCPSRKCYPVRFRSVPT